MTISSIGDILKKIVREKNWEERFRVYSVWDCWDEAVGNVVARQAQPKSFKQGCLWVGVSDPMWMHHLQMSKEIIRDNLNARLGSPLIKDIRFTLSPPGPHKDAASQASISGPDRR
ncbi:MAG: DUF721 domain-containing protein [Thermodesulfobacteriota bacterium]